MSTTGSESAIIKVGKTLIKKYSTDNAVYHTHNMINALTAPDDYTVVFADRNKFDAIISKAFAHKTGMYNSLDEHFDNYISQFGKVENFTVSQNEYSLMHLDYITWYGDFKIVSTYMKKPTVTVMYSDYGDNLDNFYDLMGIDFKLTDENKKNMSMRIRNMYDYSKIIENYDELYERYRSDLYRSVLQEKLEALDY
jgi:hypothetical protein